MNVFVFSIVFFGFFTSANARDLNIVYNFIKSTLEFYKSRSVVLLVDNTDQKKALDTYNFLNVQKMLSSKNDFYLSSLTTFSNFSKKLKNNREGVRETVVVLEFTEKSIRILEKEFNKTDFTTQKWLLTTSTLTSVNFVKLPIPLNSEFLLAEGSLLAGYNLTEIYEVEPKRQIAKALGRWVYGQRFQVNSSLDLFRRRRNLQGATIKIISPRRDNCAEASFAAGLANIVWCINQIVWSSMAQMLNATTEVIIVPNITLDVIQNRNAELTFRSAPVSAADLDTRSYIWPLFSSKVVVVASYIGQQVEWRTFILPFSKEMWMVILIWVVMCDVMLACIEFVVEAKKENSFLHCFKEFSFVTTFIFCSQGVLGPSKFASIHIIFLMILIVPGVIFPGYSAILTSFLTVNLNKKPFTNLEGLSRTKDYHLSWHRTFPLEYLFNLKDMSALNQALLQNNVLPSEKLPATDFEGIEKMCNEKVAFLSVKETVLALKPKCKYFILSKPFRIVFTSIEVKKNSSYKHFLDRCEKIIDFSGVLRRIKRKVAMKHVKYSKNINAEEAKPIAMENIVLPFVILLLGIICSGFVLILEIICLKIKSMHQLPLIVS